MKKNDAHSGFTLIELLVVIAIIATLIAVSAGAYVKVLRSADNARGHELVVNTATALSLYFQNEGVWPKAIRDAARNGDGLVDDKVGYVLAYPPDDPSHRPYMSLSLDDRKTKLVAYDKFGVVSPWAMRTLKRKGLAADLETRVFGMGTIKDHIRHFAIDYDGDGIIEGANVGGETIDIRATAVCWCAGRDGKLEPYSVGLRKDDCYSWTKGQTRSIVK